MSRVREINVKVGTYYYFEWYILQVSNLDSNNINIDEKSYKNILIYYTVYVSSNSIKPLYLNINNANGYIKESNGNNYLTAKLKILLDQ